MPGPHYLAGSSTISTEPEAGGGREVAAGGGLVGGTGCQQRATVGQGARRGGRLGPVEVVCRMMEVAGGERGELREGRQWMVGKGIGFGGSEVRDGNICWLRGEVSTW